MSFDHLPSFGPSDPPHLSVGEDLKASSQVCSQESSLTSTTSFRSPIRQHGSLLRAKIRSHPTHFKPTSERPSMSGFGEAHARSMSTLCSPISPKPVGENGFPTYREMPSQIPSATTPQTNTSSSLMTYLTTPNPAPALVHRLDLRRDIRSKHFWWDVRQIRPWTSFDNTTINAIPGLQALLDISLPSLHFPTPARVSSKPETEGELASMYNSFYGTKLNAALFTALGSRHLMMRQSTRSTSDASFVSSYKDELIDGRGGHVVGLVKSFDRWNTSMRVEGNYRKVEYLRGLSHLHHHMREHGCRYGFIITERELVVVRNGRNRVPSFGYLEVQTIQLATHDSQAGMCADDIASEMSKMTALLALWYLHMLAKDEALPGQVGWKSEIGTPAEGSRRKCLPRDGWAPEPQLVEERQAKRARGWVWPEELVGKKELTN